MKVYIYIVIYINIYLIYFIIYFYNYMFCNANRHYETLQMARVARQLVPPAQGELEAQDQPSQALGKSQGKSHQRVDAE